MREAEKAIGETISAFIRENGGNALAAHGGMRIYCFERD